MKKQMTYKTISLTVSVLVISFAIAFYALGWTEPTEDPPGGNIATPINVGDDVQVKEGSLGIVGALRGFSTFVVTGNSIDPISPGVCPSGFNWYSSGGGNGDCLVTSLYTTFDGKVGIGTKTPETRLQVEGIATEDSENLQIWHSLIDSPKAYLTLTYKDLEGIAPGGGVFIFDSTRLDPDGELYDPPRQFAFIGGNVGIGKIDPSPNVALDVIGNIVASGTICDSGGINCIGSGGAGSNLWTESGGNVYRSSGNVGIGTASPGSLLHLKTNSGSNAEINIQSGISPYWGIYQDDSSNDLRFWNTNVPGDKNALTITDEGNVGIGTKDPSEKLEVVGGSIKATGGLIIETRSSDPGNPQDGQMWLRTDINP